MTNETISVHHFVLHFRRIFFFLVAFLFDPEKWSFVQYIFCALDVRIDFGHVNQNEEKQNLI